MFFGAFEVLFFLAFITIMGTFLVTALRGLGRWKQDNRSPVLHVQATVVTKRSRIGGHHHGDLDTPGNRHAYTDYFVTFQVESGDRMELNVPGLEYGMLAEGDYGKLAFQGTRYLGFLRGEN